MGILSEVAGYIPGTITLYAVVIFVVMTPIIYLCIWLLEQKLNRKIRNFEDAETSKQKQSQQKINTYYKGQGTFKEGDNNKTEIEDRSKEEIILILISNDSFLDLRGFGKRWACTMNNAYRYAGTEIGGTEIDKSSISPKAPEYDQVVAYLQSRVRTRKDT